MPETLETLRMIDRDPVAWMGMKPDGKGGFLVRVCCCCPEKELAEKQAAKYGFKVSHGMCEKHFQEQMEALKLE